MKKTKPFSPKRLALLAMLTAISVLIVYVVRIPVVAFLKYEPKDVMIAVGGFLFGPMAALTVSVLASVIEMFTISETGIIGCIMNILSTCSFACTAALIYKKRRTMGGALAGLALGSILMIAVMLLWNWLITPLYMHQSRSDVAAMLVPIFLPFNTLKAGLNTAITLILYKPLVIGLRKAKLVEERDEQPGEKKYGLYLLAALLLITCIVLTLVLNKTI